MAEITDRNLFGHNKIEDSIEAIKLFEPKDEGYYLAFSGGKDSIVLFDLVKKANVKFEGFYNWTTCDPPELKKFIKLFYPGIQINNPEKTMWQLIRQKGLPTRRFRWCCEVLKEKYGEGKRVLTGVRREESVKRNRRKTIENCLKDKKKTFVNPILDWTEIEIWDYIKQNKIEYCPLYNEGWKRLGCVVCPSQSILNKVKSFQRWPKLWWAMYRAGKRWYESRDQEWHSKTRIKGDWDGWWNHWFYEKKTNPDQSIIFE